MTFTEINNRCSALDLILEVKMDGAFKIIKRPSPGKEALTLWAGHTQKKADLKRTRDFLSGYAAAR